MNQTAVKTIIFFADFTEDGTLTGDSRREFESCLKKAVGWKASLRLVHLRPASELASAPDCDYDNSQIQRARRRVDYSLSGLILRAEEKGVKADAGVVYGAYGLELERERQNSEDTVDWSEFAAPESPPEPRHRPLVPA